MDIADQLQKLQTLREQGALSEEEFTLAKQRVLQGTAQGSASSGTPPSPPPNPSALHQLKRSLTDRWLGGVCGGLANMSNMPSWTWRILFLLTTLLHGVGLIAYLLMWIFVPLNVEARAPVREESRPA